MTPNPYAPVLALLAVAAVLGALFCARDIYRYNRAGREWRQRPGQGRREDRP